MAKAQNRSVYEQGKRHLLAGAVIGLVCIWGIPVAASSLGAWAGSMPPWVMLPSLAWVLYFGLKSFFIACPECGRSAFLRGNLWSVPWPARSCSKCGRDLTVV